MTTATATGITWNCRLLSDPRLWPRSRPRFFLGPRTSGSPFFLLAGLVTSGSPFFLVASGSPLFFLARLLATSGSPFFPFFFLARLVASGSPFFFLARLVARGSLLILFLFPSDRCGLSGHDALFGLSDLSGRTY